MDRDDRVGDAELGFPTLSTLERGDIHVLVRLPGDGPTTQPNPPAAEVAVPVEITSRVEGAPVKGYASRRAALVLYCAWFHFGLDIGIQVVFTFPRDEEEPIAGVVLAVPLCLCSTYCRLLVRRYPFSPGNGIAQFTSEATIVAQV
ncbi:hypothetical protein PF005_g24001 [Phytophthora fragariae]|nr:hypothetical protein PF009_g26080 [Phytophthora fragariae]KAE8979580.1 hypothetical protein PF011_g22784 [Phytophthora fragariae]KAE9077416.1 hypothetical protein PF010_g23512 [Phytophthora fragariae]KAE9092785.1 hypothetical protein PF006_g24600 [Phytophthora fragariae]KAE9178629.1 hypothetical protein PF005_g24001 [Phytophthora fragariae]